MKIDFYAAAQIISLSIFDYAHVAAYLVLRGSVIKRRTTKIIDYPILDTASL